MSRYDDIINLPHHVSETRKPMSRMGRAAQFAPFAALTGHDDMIEETARLTNRRIELSDDERARLSERLHLVMECSYMGLEVSICYFKPDIVKSGGSYEMVTGIVRKFDSETRTLILDNGIMVPMSDIIGVDGEIFRSRSYLDD